MHMFHIISTKFSVYNHELSPGQEKSTSIAKIIFHDYCFSPSVSCQRPIHKQSALCVADVYQGT
jgi:hypothetical protein